MSSSTYMGPVSCVCGVDGRTCSVTEVHWSFGCEWEVSRKGSDRKGTQGMSRTVGSSGKVCPGVRKKVLRKGLKALPPAPEGEDSRNEEGDPTVVVPAATGPRPGGRVSEVPDDSCPGPCVSHELFTSLYLLTPVSGVMPFFFFRLEKSTGT